MPARPRTAALTVAPALVPPKREAEPVGGLALRYRPDAGR